MKLYLARNSDNTLELFKIKPKSFYEEGVGQYWAGGNGLFLPLDQFPEITFEGGPVEVNLVSKEKIKQVLCDRLSSIYCYNCAYDGEDGTRCEECHRKYMNWELSTEAAEKIANEILG